MFILQYSFSSVSDLYFTVIKYKYIPNKKKPNILLVLNSKIDKEVVQGIITQLIPTTCNSYLFLLQFDDKILCLKRCAIIAS